MSTTLSEVRYTPHDLLEMQDGHRFELIDGQLVEREMGAESSRVAQIINREIDNYSESQKLGIVFTTDCGYQIFADDPGKVRFPDGSFIARGRLPGDLPPRGWIRIPPDLMVEVVSPNDKAWEVDQKVDEFLLAGARLIWVFYPESRTVLAYRGRTEVTRLGEDDQLSGGDVLPGFSCRVGECFPEPSGTSK